MDFFHVFCFGFPGFPISSLLPVLSPSNQPPVGAVESAAADLAARSPEKRSGPRWWLMRGLFCFLVDIEYLCIYIYICIWIHISILQYIIYRGFETLFLRPYHSKISSQPPNTWVSPHSPPVGQNDKCWWFQVKPHHRGSRWPPGNRCRRRSHHWSPGSLPSVAKNYTTLTLLAQKCDFVIRDSVLFSLTPPMHDSWKDVSSFSNQKDNGEQKSNAF